MGRLCRGPCYLRGRKNRAKSALEDLKRAKDNLQRERRGEKANISCCTVFKRVFSRLMRAIFPCCYPKPLQGGTLTFGKPKEKLDKNYWDRFVCSGGMFGRILRKSLVLITGQLIGLLFLMAIVLKWGEDPEFIGILVGTGIQVLTIGMLAFPAVCCVGLLCLPELLTKRGRAILLLMATIWVLQGPAANINTNQVLVARSLGCVSGTMKNQTLEIKQIIKNALSERLAPFKGVLTKVRGLLRKLETTLGDITMSLNRMLSSIQRSFDWLESQVQHCKTAALSPYFKCMNALDKIEQLCDWGGVQFWFFLLGQKCSKDPFLDICECAKGIQVFCRFPERVKKFLEEQVLQKIKGSLEKAVDTVSKAFKFEIDMGRRGTYQVTVDSKINVLYEMVEKLAQKFKDAMRVLAEILNWVLVALLVLTLIKAIWYRRNFVNKDFADNNYITDSLKELDHDRELANKETILPMLPNEKRRYVTPWNLRMTKSEKRKVMAGFVHSFISTLFALIYMALDYMTHEFIYVIYVYFGDDTAVDVPNFYDVSIKGEGAVAESYDKMMKALVPALNQTTETNSWRKCIQHPSPPDYQMYKLIGIFLLASYAIVPIQVYVMRLRPCICGQFYPSRQKIRALYLYNVILKSRGGFFAFMKQGFLGEGFGEALAARQPVLGQILRVVGAEKIHCALCLQSGTKTDTDNFRICNNRDCTAAYCIECYGRLRVCRMCQLKLLMEGEMDFVEAKDSSDDEEEDLSISGKTMITIETTGTTEEAV